MNLYKFHKKPTELHRYQDADMYVLDVFWEKYYHIDKSEELKKREKEIVKSAKYSYMYARKVLEKRFPLGEPAIAKNAEYSYYYAIGVLKGRFPLGESAIAKSAKYTYWYDAYCKYFRI
jgi:hypothetical protein